ncbi:MAG: sulfatase [Capsulimonadaceae bacterium]|nr:sulfatase [Capsulimonadaceae bacterium]
MTASNTKKPNIIIFGIDSLRSDHMSAYGYHRNTTPHIDKFAKDATLFKHNFSRHIPTTSGYATMLTGMDCFTTNIVALRHKGEMAPGVRPIQTILKDAGYTTSCIGFESPSARNFDKYSSFEGWGGRKAESMNAVAVPELERLAAQEEPFLLFLRHMDPHSPYLPPKPFDRMFYHGNEFDPANESIKPVMQFKPFCDYFAAWMPNGLTDAKYVNAQYDGAIAYMDACINTLLVAIDNLGLRDDTIVVFTSDHGETLDEHECWYDHHGTYDNTLNVPMIIRYPGKLPAGKQVEGVTTLIDLVPTLLELAEIQAPDNFDGKSMVPLANGTELTHDPEFYFTECTWMRKHGWRTPEWKLIVALEPDFHFKPPVELYNLLKDPEELNNLADELPDVVAFLKGRLDAWVAKREQESGNKAPILNQPGWHGRADIDYFTSSQQAYDTLHIGDPGAAQRLQAKAQEEVAAKPVPDAEANKAANI